MASEITRDAEATFTDMHRMMVLESRARVVAQPTFFQDSLEGIPTLAKTYPKHPTTADAAAWTEGTGMSNTGINATAVTNTAAGVGLKSVVTDESATGSLLDVSESAANFARALTNKIEVDCTALYVSLDTTVGTSGSDLTVAQFQTALYTQELNNEDNNLVAVLHPIQAYDLRAAIVAASGAIYSNPSEFNGGFVSIQQQALKGTLFGVPIYVSSTVPTANAAADRAGGLYSANRAFAFVWKWRPRLETIREPAMPGTLIAVSAAYGVVEVVGTAGTAIVTDA